MHTSSTHRAGKLRSDDLIYCGYETGQPSAWRGISVQMRNHRTRQRRQSIADIGHRVATRLGLAIIVAVVIALACGAV